MSNTAVVAAPNALQTDRVRDTMSFSNILSSPTGTADATADVKHPSSPAAAQDGIVNGRPPTPPFTPAKVSTAAPKAEMDSPETMTLDIMTPKESDNSVDDDTDAEDVPDSEREFICKNDETSRCITGQYTLELSRKVISDHFGRNKACTRDIADWPLFCRKHYQRATYNKQLWQIRKLGLIFRQFDVIEAQFPGTTYDIHFKKSEETRLNMYSRKIAAGWPEDKAAQSVAPKEPSKHFEAPIDILRELDLDLGTDKTIEEVKDITQKILRQIQDEAVTQVPAIEFLPTLPGKMSSPKKKAKAPKTPSPKKRRNAKTPSSKGTPGRVSSKGSIKKPN